MNESIIDWEDPRKLVIHLGKGSEGVAGREGVIGSESVGIINKIGL